MEHASVQPAAAGHAATTPPMLGLLSLAAERIEQSGPDVAGSAARLRDLARRLAEERFHLAVLGQFKRGKSTLLNALLGEPLLPSAVVPLTSIPTFVQAGPRREARVLFRDESRPPAVCQGDTGEISAFLAGFVAEEHNPRNQLGVAQVEVWLPAPILERGVVLIDTPGIGSTFRHNTEATLNFLPQCDAALFVVSADPPVTEVELEFLRQVRAKVARLFFVLNKVDYLDQAERRQAADFLREVLRRQPGFGEEPVLFCVSARQGLEAASQHDRQLWAGSGLEPLSEYLTAFLSEGKASALREAVARKAFDLIAEALLRLELAVKALEMPLADLAERLTLFEHSLEAIGQEQQIASDLLAGDQRRMYQFLEERCAALRDRGAQALEQAVSQALEGAAGADCHAQAQKALDERIPVFFEHELGALIQEVDARVATVLKPHQLRATELIAKVRRTASELFDVPYHAPESEGVFAVKRQPYWVTAKWMASISPIPPIHLDRLLPRALRTARVRKRLLAQIQDLVRHNVENARWATLQNLDQAFLRFGAVLRESLENTVAATYGAMEAASRRRREQAGLVSGEVARLRETAAELRALGAAILGVDGSQAREP